MHTETHLPEWAARHLAGCLGPDVELVNTHVLQRNLFRAEILVNTSEGCALLSKSTFVAPRLVRLPLPQFGKVTTTYRPQCMGLTAAELQCRNSARRASKYCASHRGYRPPEESATQKKGVDTLPHFGKAEDTEPSFRHHAKTNGAAKTARKTVAATVNDTKG